MAYLGTSIVDYLKSVGQQSDFASRSKLAKEKGIANYTGASEQNLNLLNTLRTAAEAPPAQPPTVGWQKSPFEEGATYGAVAKMPPTPSPVPALPVPVLPPTQSPTLTEATKTPTSTMPDYRQQMLDLISGIQKSQQEYQTKLSALPSPTQQYQQYREQLGMPAKEQEVAGIRTQVQNTENLLNKLESDINERISGRGVSEALRRRTLVSEQTPLQKTYTELLRGQGIAETGMTSARQQLADLMSTAGQERTQQEALAKLPYEQQLALLPAMEEMIKYQTPQEELAQTIAKEQAEKLAGVGTYAKPSYTEVAPGGTVIDPATGKVIYTAPPKIAFAPTSTPISTSAQVSPEIKTWAQDVLDGTVTLTSVPDKIQAQVSQRVKELQTRPTQEWLASKGYKTDVSYLPTSKIAKEYQAEIAAKKTEKRMTASNKDTLDYVDL